MTLHGHTSKNAGASPTYNSWHAMKKRCLLETDASYPNYGGRGVTYGPAWENFTDFLADMGERPYGKTLERVDNAKGYTKTNCVWATPLEQAQNRRKRCDNSSGVTGVSWQAAKQKWRVRCTYAGKLQTLYYGPCKEKAIRIRKDWEVLHGRK